MDNENTRRVPHNAFGRHFSVVNAFVRRGGCLFVIAGLAIIDCDMPRVSTDVAGIGIQEEAWHK